MREEGNGELRKIKEAKKALKPNTNALGKAGKALKKRVKDS